MADNSLGELRRSSVVTTFAPGAVVDFRAGGAPVSALVAGLEEWDRSFPPGGLANPQTITEPRLQRKLGVDGFRLPPVVAEGVPSGMEEDRRSLVAVRFPTWLQCPLCDQVGPASGWGKEPGRAYRYCGPCSARQPGGRRVHVIPVRFVLACTAGHIDEFPWHDWVAHRPGCAGSQGKLLLRAERPGLPGLILACPRCGQRRSMDGIFGRETFSGFTCRARRPWLSEEVDPQGCGRIAGQPRPELRAVQRGASNLYFPATESALSIPPWSDRLQQSIGVYWADIVNVENDADRERFIEILARGPLSDILRDLGMTAVQLAAAIRTRLSGLQMSAGEDLRLEEYRQLSSGIDTERGDELEFEVRNCQVPERLRPVLGRAVRVPRLREVRALRGFTRIYQPGTPQVSLAPIASKALRWLPAAEVRGEGIFLGLEGAPVAEWETRDPVIARMAALAAAIEEERKERPLVGPPAEISARFVLLHTLAHALMREVTLECGYSTASLRERLYVSSGPDGIAGVLVYTATGDSDGTLGGLERQAAPGRLESIFLNAIGAMEWCSSDPLCLEGAVGGLELFSLAACHGCCLAPETSCEHFNRYLDRALLIGTPADPALGFFRQLL